MKLISLAQSGEVLPPSLPASMIPASKIKKPVSVIAPPTSSLGGSPHTSIPGSPILGKKATTVIVSILLLKQYNI